ncbi:MAG: hypothetical protein IT289_06495, partial [Oligoflexia bacterium]|nr:hypothetical protein [Oligoflexia bacterium]
MRLWTVFSNFKRYLLTATFLVVAGCKVASVDDSMKGSISRGYSFSLNDPTAPAGIAKQATVNVVVTTQDGNISQWCISETQTTQPANTSTCTGGTWWGTKPSTFTLSNGGGLKTVYLWAANGNGVVRKTKTFSATIYRQVPPQLNGWITPAAIIYQTANSYNFSWNAATTDVAAPVLDPVNTYFVERFDNGSCSGAPVAPGHYQNQATTNYNWVGLAEGVYSIRLTAYDVDGTGSVPSCSSAVYRDSIAPIVSIDTGPTQPVSTSSAANFTFTVTDAAPSSGLNIECFLDAVSQGACSGSLNFATIADGNHLFRVTATDNAGNSATATWAWNINTLVITGTSSFYTFDNVNWSQNFTGSGGTGAANYTWSIFSGPGSVLGNGTATAAVSYNNPTAQNAAHSIVLRLTDTVSTNTKDFTITLESYENAVCLWTGGTSITWTDPANWTNCGGTFPVLANKIAVLSTAPFMPRVTGTTQIDSFGKGPGGGTVTIAAAANLDIYNGSASFMSDVRFIGNTPTCINCRVRTWGSAGFTVKEGATVTFLDGLRVNRGTGGGTVFYVGDCTSAGHLAAESLGASNTYTATDFSRIDVCGTATEKSTINWNGFNFSYYFLMGYGASIGGLYLRDYYDITKFDNVIIGDNGNAVNISYIWFASCTNAPTLTDTAWDNITIAPPVYTSGYNIRVDGTNCTTVPWTVTVSNTPGTSGGRGYGSQFEMDPGNKINWSNSLSRVCTWTGANGTSWTDSGNWAGCTNDRGNYPDQLDSVIIPDVANDPVVASHAVIKKFEPSAGGGGIITVNPNVIFTISDITNSIESSIQFKGTAGCSTCQVQGAGGLEITNDAVVTLLTNITFGPLYWNGNRTLYLGNGDRGGHLVTGPPDASSNNWPLISSGNNPVGQNFTAVILNGVNSPSSIKWDGIRTANYSTQFQGVFEIEQFDNVLLGVLANDINSSNATGGLTFNNCAGATITDTTWSNLTIQHIIPRGGYNINASHASCAALPAVSITYDTARSSWGYGSLYENDPFGKFTWGTDTNEICTWAGTWDSDFTNPNNWTGCTNNRHNYPD